MFSEGETGRFSGGSRGKLVRLLETMNSKDILCESIKGNFTSFIFPRSSRTFLEDCKERDPPMFGKLHKNASVIRSQDSKWAVPRYIYNQDHYPRYLTGPAFVLPRYWKFCLITL